jgi:polysaccharide export outer membrane protein
MKKFLLISFLLILLCSCVPTKKMTYFQGIPVQKEAISKFNNEPYRLQVNDMLYINIKAEKPELVSLFATSETSGSSVNSGGNLYFSGYSVDRHGNIRIPYLGDVNVLGYTEKEVREKIETELVKYFKKPESIFVTVKLAGISFVVSGEVGSPGTINLAQNQVTIIDAISNAGDITEIGNREKVSIIRKTLDGVARYEVDFTKIEIFESENFYLKPNDVIYVPPLKQKSWGTGTTGLQTFSTLVTVFSFIVSTVLLVKTL